MKRFLQVWFIVVFFAMLAVTTWASLEKNVVQAFVDLGKDRWGLATLFDAYFGFLAVYVWMYARLHTTLQRLLWLVALLLLGNFAIAAWFLWALAQWDGKRWPDLFFPGVAK